MEDLESDNGGEGGCERACGSAALEERRSSKGVRPPRPPPPEDDELILGLSRVRRLRSGGSAVPLEPTLFV